MAMWFKLYVVNHLDFNNFQARRTAAFQKSLSELAELELKHSRAHAQMLRSTIEALKSEL